MMKIGKRQRDHPAVAEHSRRFRVWGSRGIGFRTLMTLLLLVAVLPLLLVEAVVYAYWFTSNETRAIEANTELARSVAAAFESYVNDLAHDELTLVAAIAAKWPYPVDELTSLLETSAAHYPALNAYLFWGTDGKVIATSDPRLKALPSITDRQYFQRALRTRDYVLSDLLEGRADPNPIFIVARGVYRGDELIGILTASVDPVRLGEATLKVARLPGGGVSFYDRQGQLVYQHPLGPLSWDQRRHPESGDLLQRALKGQEASGLTKLYGEDQDRIAVRVPIATLGWVAGASQPKRVLLMPLLRSLLLAAGASLAALALSLTGAWFITRSIVRGIFRLRVHTLDVGRGRMAPIGRIGRVREINDLAGSFNEMTKLRQQAEGQLKQAAADLARSNQELEQYAYVAAHDLQEPLRMVTGHLSLIQRRLEDKLDAETLQAMSFAVDGAKRMQHLIRDLLTYSRVGRPEAGFVPTDMEEALGRAVAKLNGARAQTGAIITHAPLPTVRAEPAQMAQLLQNLLDNAVKFRAPGRQPQVHVAARRQQRGWVFSVRDNGIGIDTEYAQKIFMIFQRLHGRQEYPGTGIGLAICKRITDYHCGRIWVESKLKEGATFFFTIPDRP